jgi:acyl dehydratase
MFALAAGKARTGQALANPVLVTDGRVTLVHGILTLAVLLGLVLNAMFGFYALREAMAIFSPGHWRPQRTDSLTG